MRKDVTSVISKNKREVKFSQRQLEIMTLWAECDNAIKIAEKLSLSVHTIRTQQKRMRKKLGVSRTFEVYKFINKKNKH